MKSKIDKWEVFKNDRYYTLKNLGRPAVFLLPLGKLNKKDKGLSIEEGLHQFLLKNFGAYTTSVIPNFGFWRDNKKKIVYDKCREYEVSFVGKKKIPMLLRKLSEVAKLIKEECIYFKAGQYTCLVFPEIKKPLH